MFSLVIPTYTIDTSLENLALEAARSYKYEVDELIITEDGGKFSPKLQAIADTYIYNWKNKGFTFNVNRGWKVASGDFVAIANSDTYLYKGKIRDLCIPGKVTSPTVLNQGIERLAGPFWVAPKEVTKERGYLMEEMEIYCSDSEYDNRIADIFQSVPSVEIFHHIAKTVTMAGCEGHEQMAKDREIYNRLKAEGRAK